MHDVLLHALAPSLQQGDRGEKACRDQQASPTWCANACAEFGPPPLSLLMRQPLLLQRMTDMRNFTRVLVVRTLCCCCGMALQKPSSSARLSNCTSSSSVLSGAPMLQQGGRQADADTVGACSPDREQACRMYARECHRAPTSHKTQRVEQHHCAAPAGGEACVVGRETRLAANLLHPLLQQLHSVRLATKPARAGV